MGLDFPEELKVNGEEHFKAKVLNVVVPHLLLMLLLLLFYKSRNDYWFFRFSWKMAASKVVRNFLKEAPHPSERGPIHQ